MIDGAEAERLILQAIEDVEAAMSANRPTLRQRRGNRATVAGALGSRAIGLYVALEIINGLRRRRVPRARSLERGVR